MTIRYEAVSYFCLLYTKMPLSFSIVRLSGPSSKTAKVSVLSIRLPFAMDHWVYGRVSALTELATMPSSCISKLRSSDVHLPNREVRLISFSTSNPSSPPWRVVIVTLSPANMPPCMSEQLSWFTAKVMVLPSSVSNKNVHRGAFAHHAIDGSVWRYNTYGVVFSDWRRALFLVVTARNGHHDYRSGEINDRVFHISSFLLFSSFFASSHSASISASVRSLMSRPCSLAFFST